MQTYISGEDDRKKANRPEYQRMLDILRAVDTLVADSFSRLTRSTKDLLDVVEGLIQKGVNLISLKEKLETTTSTWKLMLTMLSALSQFERDIIAERTRDGLKAARARGKQGGSPKVDETALQKALKLYDAEKLSIKEISDVTGISTSIIKHKIAERRRGINLILFGYYVTPGGIGQGWDSERR